MKRAFLFITVTILIVACSSQPEDVSVTMLPEPSSTDTSISDIPGTLSVNTPIDSPTTRPPTNTPKPSPSPTSTSIPTGPFKPVLIDKELPPNLVSILHISEDGRIWLQTEQEILVLTENTWEVALPDIQGDIIGVDQSDHVWIINENGSSISSWNGKEWRTYSEESGWIPLMEYSFVKKSLVTDQFTQLWVVTSEDLRVFNGKRWTRFTPKDLGLSHPLEVEENILPKIYLKYLEMRQELWLGSCNWTGAGPIGGQGVLRYDGISWHKISDALSSGCTEAIVEDREGKIWIGLEGDVWRYDPVTGMQDKFGAPPSPFGDSGFFAGVGNIVVDAENTPWADLLFCGGAGCGFGTILYHLDGGEWIEIIQEDFRLHNLIFDSFGVLWLLTPGGIFEIDGNQLQQLIELPIVPTSVLKNRDGQAWFLVKRGDVSELWTLESDISN